MMLALSKRQAGWDMLSQNLALIFLFLSLEAIRWGGLKKMLWLHFKSRYFWKFLLSHCSCLVHALCWTTNVKGFGIWVLNLNDIYIFASGIFSPLYSQNVSLSVCSPNMISMIYWLNISMLAWFINILILTFSLERCGVKPHWTISVIMPSELAWQVFLCSSHVHVADIMVFTCATVRAQIFPRCNVPPK